jgi:hypothetical protein
MWLVEPAFGIFWLTEQCRRRCQPPFKRSFTMMLHGWCQHLSGIDSPLLSLEIEMTGFDRLLSSISFTRVLKVSSIDRLALASGPCPNACTRHRQRLGRVSSRLLSVWYLQILPVFAAQLAPTFIVLHSQLDNGCCRRWLVVGYSAYTEGHCSTRCGGGWLASIGQSYRYAYPCRLFILGLGS